MPGGRGDLADDDVEHPGQQETEDQRQEDRDPGPRAAEGHRRDNGEDHH